MKITFAPKDILQIDDARIIFPNFSGEPGKYNRKGDRNFAIVIEDEETANELAERGWNVRIKPGRNEDEPPRMHLPVKINFNEYGPNVYLKSGRAKQIRLTEETISMLDRIDILTASMDIRPYDWKLDDGSTGRSAYLKDMKVIQDVNRFADDEDEDDQF